MKREFKLLSPLKDLIAGATLSLQVDSKNLPIIKYWRRRVMDSKIDNCMEMLPLRDENHADKKKSKKIDKEETKSGNADNK